jgi:adenylylsulfate kinase/chloramphenicol 3-O phosphotransferase
MFVQETNDMHKGLIIYLSGVTSTGKTWIARDMQKISNEFFYVIGSDILIGMVGEKYLDENHWKYESEMFVNMYHIAKLFFDMGKNIIIDSALFETPELPDHYQKVKSILADCPLLMVEVVCPLEICGERNVVRGDREAYQSERQDKIMDKNVPFDFSVRTEILP